jgi:beta-lactamase class A
MTSAAPESRAAAQAAREAVEGAVAAIARAFPSAAMHVGLSDPSIGLRLGLRDREKVHAASTMKLPVLLEARRRVAEGELRLEQAVRLHNCFASLEGGPPYALDAADDSDPDLHLRLGGEAAVGELLERMIVRSSNLATNLVLELVPPPAVTRLCRSLGASDIEVLRGVEDAVAFRAGRNNLATAHDLVVLLEALAERRIPGADPCVETLARQEQNEGIPQGLPPGTRTAHKTGSIRGCYHDAALVLPPGAPSYALAVLTRGFPSEVDAVAAVRAVSAAAWAALRGAGSTSSRRG